MRQPRKTFDSISAKLMILAVLDTYGQMTGERIVDELKARGFEPKDDRAFGPIFASLNRQRKIHVVGTGLRRKGHRASGALVWAVR